MRGARFARFPFALRPWRLSGMLTPTRTVGEVGFRRNGTSLDIWLRVNGHPTWVSLPSAYPITGERGALREYLDHVAFDPTDAAIFVLLAESDGNAEDEQ